MSAGSRARLGVLVSGRGTNLDAILAACRSGVIDADVVMVASNRASCPALEVARETGVPAVAFTIADHGDIARRDAAMAAAMTAASVDLVVTAGYDRVLSDAFVAAFAGRILNVHPSLLPAFAGTMNAIRDAFEAGVKVTGVTIHFIDPGTVDAGAIAAQEAVEINDGDSLAEVEARVHAAEHRLLPATIQLFVEGRLRREAGRVVVDGHPVRLVAV